MHAAIIFVGLLGFVAGHREVLDPGTCVKTPRSSLLILLALTHADECHLDSDCQAGAQCCYNGFTKKCIFPDPCQIVSCTDGHICQRRETPCQTPPCRLEATCLPASEVLCVAPVCNTTECEPGFERFKGTDGCRTCQCVKKKECGTNCDIFCAHGFEQSSNGCPLCSCKPEPESPCSNKSCAPKHECRFIKVTCRRTPCEPVAMCVPVVPALYENACSLTDRTTVGLPVLNSIGGLELDCSSHVCPGHTVCTRMGLTIKRCCWQSTQLQTVYPPKLGVCPLTRNYSELIQECITDESCPGDQKCCHEQPGDSSLSSGLCANPVYSIAKVVPPECRAFSFVRIILSFLGVC